MSGQLEPGHEKYRRGRVLGQGCSGIVYEATRMDDSRSFALKIVKAASMEDNVVKTAFREASIMKRITMSDMAGQEFSIPWIVSIEDFWVDDEVHDGDPHGGIGICMIIELVTGPSLEAYLDRVSHPRMKRRSTGGYSKVRPGEELSDEDEKVIEISADTVYFWTSQIILALALLHSSQVVHRDIKPANLILSKDLRTIKLADFSASRELEAGEPTLDTVAGTLNYSAPEVLRGKPCGPSCDLWSLGCVVYEICTLQKAFKIANTTKILSSINKQEIPSIPDDYDPGLVMLCNRLLNPDPDRRPTAVSLCKHPRLKPFIIHHMCEITRIPVRKTIAKSLGIEGMLPQTDDIYQAPSSANTELHLVDENNPAPLCAIEDQYDDDIGYEVLHLFQGTWVLDGSNPRVNVEVSGRDFRFSDGRPLRSIRRAFHKDNIEPIEWVLGDDAILLKAHSRFVSPQKLFFASLVPQSRETRKSALEHVCLVLVRDQPVSSVYHSAESA